MSICFACHHVYVANTFGIHLFCLSPYLCAISVQAASLQSIQELAGAAADDEVCQHDHVQVLAGCGANGKWKQNIERDMDRKMKKLFNVQSAVHAGGALQQIRRHDQRS